MNYTPGQLCTVIENGAQLWDKPDDPKYRRRQVMFAPDEFVDNVMGTLAFGEYVTLVDVVPGKVRVKVLTRLGPGWIMRYYLKFSS